MGYTPPFLDVRRIAGAYKVYGPSSTSGDDLYILANTTDNYPSITMLGLDNMVFSVSTGKLVRVYDQTAGYILGIGHATPDIEITALANKNIYLKTSGTGLIKVPGTVTATGDVAINGHYDILDSTGATIKLATVA